MLTDLQRARIAVVLVSPRNPLNIGAAARAMANFGFSRLAVVAPFEPHWREARSAIGAENLLQNATRAERLDEAVSDCTLVIGTGTLTHRKPEQPIVPLPNLAPIIAAELARGGRIALVFGPEKRGLTREDLAHCHMLVEIPTNSGQPSMNLGQAVAVCLYELAVRPGSAEETHFDSPAEMHPGSAGECGPAVSEFESGLALSDFESGPGLSDFRGEPRTISTGIARGNSAESPISISRSDSGSAASSRDLALLAEVVEQTMLAANYSPSAMHRANRHDLHLLLRRLALTPRDARRIMGLFRRVLWRMGHPSNTK